MAADFGHHQLIAMLQRGKPALPAPARSAS